MTKRYFYTDALAAAWMEAKFGLRFIDVGGNDIWFQPVNSSFGYYLSGEKPVQLRFVSKPKDAVASILHQELTFRPAQKAYISPDSLHLSDPCVGDILRIYFHSPEEDDKHGAVMTGFYAGGREALTWFRNPEDGSIEKQLHKIDDHQWGIIQRNGIVFHAPESENTNG